MLETIEVVVKLIFEGAILFALLEWFDVLPLRRWVSNMLAERRQRKALKELRAYGESKGIPHVPGESVSAYRRRLTKARDVEAEELQRLIGSGL